MTLARISFLSLLLLAACVLIPLESAAAQTTADGTPCAWTIGDGNGGQTCYNDQGQPIGPAVALPSGIGLGGNLQIDPTKTLGCDRRGDIPDSVASYSTIGGPYVPVSDLAVTRNTFYLVYKECVLDPVANKMRQAAIAKLIDTDATLINEGDNGNPFFAQNLELERAKVTSRVLSEFMEKNYATASICGTEEHKQEVKLAVARAILAQTSETEKPGACTFEGEDEEYQKFLDGKFIEGGGFKTLWNFAKNPSNAPLFAYVQKKSEVEAQIAQYQQDRLELIRMGDGFLPKEEPVDIPLGNGDTRRIYKVNTPGIVHSEMLKNIITSPLDQLEMADEMDKVVDGGLSTLTSHVLSSPKGLEGITKNQSSGTGGGAGGGDGSSGGSGGGSILDQILQSVLGLIIQTAGSGGSGGGSGGGSTTNAVPALASAILNEQQFVTYRGQVLANLATTTKQFRSAENACWTTMVQAVTVHANGAAFTPATTTQNSTLAIADVVTPIETPMKAEIALASTSIATLQGFLATLATSSSQANHQAAFTALAQMQEDKKLHTTAETTVAGQAITSIKSVVDTRASATITAWKTGSGWCNASSTAVVSSWFNAWKQ